MHALETGNLERLHRSAIPQNQFDTMPSIDEYVRASRSTIAELEKLYGRRVRVVHPLPDAGTLAERKQLVETIYGGGGFDLDSLVTLVPDRNGKWTAFVADLSQDDAWIRATPPEDWSRFRSVYGIATSPEDLPNALALAQRSARARGLDAFADLIAASLSRDGMKVERLPLFLVPVSLLSDRSTLEHSDFIIGWNNVVFERDAASRLRAIAFASGLASADRKIVERFRAAGVDLQLLPPLVRSVILNGGYRCASNSIRGGPSRRRHIEGEKAR
jgi:hypothetical protein